MQRFRQKAVELRIPVALQRPFVRHSSPTAQQALKDEPSSIQGVKSVEEIPSG